MSESENETKGFKVTDRRQFTTDGEPRAGGDESQPQPTADTQKAEEVRAKEQPAPGLSEDQRAKPGPFPEAGFVDLVNMLAVQALVQLGDLPDPVSGERQEELSGVQWMIALLTLLQEKTKGNLNAEEEKLLDDVLYDLRMRFMAKANLIKI